MGLRIYVGGLFPNTTDVQLRELLEPFGTVTVARVIMNRLTGRSRGYGFVEMGSEEEARNAVVGLNGVDRVGQVLRCFSI